ncbi:MAG: hypothetical protein BMS9Abin05_0444 [Rhodothermia bacterium]|nr:MAG: hypothetical protein BMS9Abin05_0444 [Rhodothermia bacterium]
MTFPIFIIMIYRHQIALPGIRLIWVFLFALCFGLLFTTESSAQAVEGRWRVLSEGPEANRRHDDVAFINESEGWIVNLEGKVYGTKDGGSSWELLHNNLFVGFRSVAFANDRIGYLGTLSPGSVLLQTFDGGRNWINLTDRIKGTTPQSICGLWAVDENTIYGVGAFFGGPWLVKSTDGGVTWTSKVVGAGAKTLVDVYFKNRDEGYAVGGTADTGDGLRGNAVVLRTTDGGSNWTQVHQTNHSSNVGGEWGWKISFPSELVGYVSLEYTGNNKNEPAKYLKTVDGGLTWTEHHIPGSTQVSGLQGIGFITENIGWASGRGQTSVTIDGGTTWQQIAAYNPETNPNGELDGRTNRIFVLNNTLAYAVGKYTYKFEGTIPVRVVPESVPERPAQFQMYQNYPNPFQKSTTIGYTLFEKVDVLITVRDVLGRQVRTLMHEFQSPGKYTVTWDGRDETGSRLANGTYLYLMDIGEQIEIKHAVLLR